MYIIEMNEDAGYEGFFTTSIVVSNNKEKLDCLAITLKHNLIHISEQMKNFRNYLDNKYQSLRIKCVRTPEEVMELNNYEEQLNYNYPEISKYNLFNYWYTFSEIDFIVKEIPEL